MAKKKAKKPAKRTPKRKTAIQATLPGVKLTEYEYSSNNSGGTWWLKDEDWRKLEAAGWRVRWVKDGGHPFLKPGEDRWLGALATAAFKAFPSEDAARDEFEAITGQDANAEGCNCCGQPHNFYEVTP